LVFDHRVELPPEIAGGLGDFEKVFSFHGAILASGSRRSKC
jgi:hypothetical protein